MCRMQGLVVAALSLFVLAAASERADAAIARYHYVLANPNGALQLQSGERVSVFGRVADTNPPSATSLLPMRHRITGQTVLVPLAFPQGTPRVYHRPGRLVYSWGSYTVEVLFLADGSLDVIYNSGWFRAV